MRPVRVTLMLAASAAVLLAGCTDPSPDAPPEPASDSPAGGSSTASAEAGTAESSETPTEEAPEPPFFGVGSPNEGIANACVSPTLGEPVAVSTALTAVDEVTIDELVVGGDEVEMLDAYVLPYSGASGLFVDYYPPQDPESAREDAAGYVVRAGETVIVGVGVGAEGPDPVTITLGLDYTDGEGGTGTIDAGVQLTLAEEC